MVALLFLALTWPKCSGSNNKLLGLSTDRGLRCATWLMSMCVDLTVQGLWWAGDSPAGGDKCAPPIATNKEECHQKESAAAP